MEVIKMARKASEVILGILSLIVQIAGFLAALFKKKESGGGRSEEK